MKWVTRSHVHVDRVACPWLISRFVDSQAEFIFVPKNRAMDVAKEQDAIRHRWANTASTRVWRSRSYTDWNSET